VADRALIARLDLAREHADDATLADSARLARTWYLSEGSSHPSFETLAILNPSPRVARVPAPAPAPVQPRPSHRRSRGIIVVHVLAHAQVIVDVARLPSRQRVVIVARADRPVLVERAPFR